MNSAIETICADVNTAHPNWDNCCATIDRKADIIMDFLNDISTLTLNTGNFTHLHHSSSRAIDITSVSPNLFNKISWKIIDDDYGSDQLLVLTETTTNNSCHSNKIIVNYKKSTIELNAMPDEEINKLISIDELTNTIENVILNNSRNAKVNNFNFKPWWNDQLQQQKEIRNQCLKYYRENLSHAAFQLY